MGSAGALLRYISKMGTEVDTAAVLGFVTLAIAVLGAVLGVLNTYMQWRVQRARVRVQPLVARINGNSLRFCIEITNLSAFPLTLTSVSLVRGRGEPMFGFHPEFLTGQRLPIRLEARTSITAFLPAGAEQHEAFAGVRNVQVETQCGCIASGRRRSGAMRWFVEHRPEAAEAGEIQDLGGGWGTIAKSPYGPPKTTVGPLQK